MITKDIQSYARSKWDEFLCPITELSRSDKGGPLVESQVKLYNFDAICKGMFPRDKTPASADALSCSNEGIELVEFKSGFKQRITKNKFDAEKGRCPETGKICEEYWKLFFKNQTNSIKELISSIRFKAIESYITMEKKIFPDCSNIDVSIPIKLTVVIDENEIDNIEDTYAELAGNVETKDNCFQQIRNSLKRLKRQKSADKADYYYDSIDVISAQDYLNRCSMMP
mgnify:FL=1